jgi:hypothetical protein
VIPQHDASQAATDLRALRERLEQTRGTHLPDDLLRDIEVALSTPASEGGALARMAGDLLAAVVLCRALVRHAQDAAGASSRDQGDRRETVSDRAEHARPSESRDSDVDGSARLHGWDDLMRRIVPAATHRCAAMESAARLRSHMEAEAADHDIPPEILWGPAVTRIDRAAGHWWMHNEEYSNPIRYCPWCGQDLERGAP